MQRCVVEIFYHPDHNAFSAPLTELFADNILRVRITILFSSGFINNQCLNGVSRKVARIRSSGDELQIEVINKIDPYLENRLAHHFHFSLRRFNLSTGMWEIASRYTS